MAGSSRGCARRDAVCMWIAEPAPAFVPARARPKKLHSRSPTPCDLVLELRGPRHRDAVPGARQRSVRYVADASYWIYLVHLRSWRPCRSWWRLPWHWAVNLLLILVVSFTVLFLAIASSCAQLHRQLLNAASTRGSGGRGRGSRHRRSPVHDRQPPRRRASHRTLSGVHKRYGKTVALAGLDLDVRRGELLALLGPNGAGKSTAICCGWDCSSRKRAALLFGGSPLDVEGRRRSA